MGEGELIGYICFGIGLATALGVTFIALKNWRGDRYLCDDCIFNNDQDCRKAERPKALRCTVYRNGRNHIDYEF